MSRFDSLKKYFADLMEDRPHIRPIKKESWIYDKEQGPEDEPRKQHCFRYNPDKTPVWMEWWTVFVYGGEEDEEGTEPARIAPVSGLINYIFIKAKHLPGVGIVFPTLLTKDGDKQEAYHTVDKYKENHFHGNTNKPHVVISNGKKHNEIVFEEYDENQPERFRITGETKDGIASWDMTFEREEGVQPWKIAQEVKLSAFADNFSWMSYMPAAKANGSVTVNGKKYPVKGARGEHDHCWGDMIQMALSWTLLHCYTPIIKELNKSFAIFFLEGYDHGILRIVALSDGKPTIYKWTSKEYKIDLKFENMLSTYPNYAKIVGNSPTCGKVELSASCTSISASDWTTASENNALFDVKINTVEGEEMVFQAGGWLEFQKTPIAYVKDVL